MHCLFLHLVQLGCGSTSSQNNTYLVQTSVSSNSLSPCVYDICKCGSNICRIRFDFTVSAKIYLSFSPRPTFQFALFSPTRRLRSRAPKPVLWSCPRPLRLRRAPGLATAPPTPSLSLLPETGDRRSSAGSTQGSTVSTRRSRDLQNLFIIATSSDCRRRRRLPQGRVRAGDWVDLEVVGHQSDAVRVR